MRAPCSGGEMATPLTSVAGRRPSPRRLSRAPSGSACWKWSISPSSATRRRSSSSRRLPTAASTWRASPRSTAYFARSPRSRTAVARSRARRRAPPRSSLEALRGVERGHYVPAVGGAREVPLPVPVRRRVEPTHHARRGVRKRVRRACGDNVRKRVPRAGRHPRLAHAPHRSRRADKGRHDARDASRPAHRAVAQ
jgi:hypothetical protein